MPWLQRVAIREGTMNTINGETVYTADEVRVSNERAMADKTEHISEIVRDVLVEEIHNANLTEEYALGLYNRIADRVGDPFPNLTALSKTFTVTVKYGYDEVLTVSGVKALDEDEAVQEVSDNLTVSGARLTFDIEYDGDGNASDSVEVDYDDDEISSNLDVTAEED